jgi:hypothetical protein
MRIGLVGFAGSGKTTVFNTLTGLNVATGFGGEVHLGTVKVPDERIDKLSAIFSPKKTTYAEIVFSDIPGEHGAEHKGLSGKALQQIREQDVLCLVLRDFANPALEIGHFEMMRATLAGDVGGGSAGGQRLAGGGNGEHSTQAFPSHLAPPSMRVSRRPFPRSRGPQSTKGAGISAKS